MDLSHVTDPDALYDAVVEHFGLRVPRQRVCPGHDAPWDFVWRSYFEDRDLVVWSCRGGGKSRNAALATVLRAAATPGVEQVILGGSQEQSDRVAEHVRDLLGRVPDLLHPQSRRRRIRLANDSLIRVLAQSETAVRGIHADRVRCDEVELFTPDVWRAVRFCTAGRRLGRGALDVLSTAHVPGGIMEDLIARCRAGTHPARLVAWCLWEVIEPCPPERRCDECALAPDCGGRARQGTGFFRIDDALAMQARVSRAAWEAEMLCRGARQDYLVLGEFDPAVHVRDVKWDARLDTVRAIDFGYSDPFVCLWLQLAPEGAVHVVDEYVRSRKTVQQHAVEIKRRDRGPVGPAYVDPAGKAVSAVGGVSAIGMLELAGIHCVHTGSSVADGLELIRAALAPAAGPPRLFIAPRCRTLIEAFGRYHYPAPGSAGDPEVPVKDGPDHAIDALRYFYVNRFPARAKAKMRTY